MTLSPLILWFRLDLRLQDNPALSHALETGRPLIPVFIYDQDSAGEHRIGEASRWWLHNSLEKLSESLDGKLATYTGRAEEVIPQIVKNAGADTVYWNRCYEPWRIKRDKAIKQNLKDEGIHTESFNSALIFEPWDVLKDDGDPYRVFTPFYKAGQKNFNLPAPCEYDKKSLKKALNHDRHPDGGALDLLPSPAWYEKMARFWTPGEQGAMAQLDKFLDEGLANYKEGRNRPDKPYVSRLSPYLHHGEISPSQVWSKVEQYGYANGLEKHADAYNREIVWREFSYNLLYHFPDLPSEPLQENFNAFPWNDDKEALEKWKAGQTGYPIVDAGMRELWETGYMHNRVRMIVGSFLVKHLRLHWHHGEAWFWDCLVDADLANNSASWQWISGCGADAAPYFRIFNPMLQGNKFDPDGDYVRRWVPELKEMPQKHIHTPWEAPKDVLEDAGVVLGETYPHPIVDHGEARQQALDAYDKIKKDK